MSDAPVSLALIGCPEDINVWRDIAARLRHGTFRVAVDADPRRAQSAAEALRAGDAVSSCETALDQHGEDFDAVVIHNPLVHGPEVAKRAAESGKHILASSPVAATMSDVKSLIATCNQSGVHLGICGTSRFVPSIQTVMQRLANGKLGEPGLLRFHHWESRSDQPLVKTLYNAVDLAIWLFGALPREIQAVGKQSAGSTADWDYVQLHFGFPAGGMALLDFSTSLPEGQSYDSWSLIGSRGAAYADDHHNTHLLYAGDHPRALISREGLGHQILEYQAFIDAIREGQPPPVSGSDCLAVHQVIDAVMRSLDLGSVCRIEGGRDESV